MQTGYCSRNGVEQTNEDLKNPERENEPGSSILQKIPASCSDNARSATARHTIPSNFSYPKLAWDF